MKMTVERELRVEDVFSGKIISVKRTYDRVYGYVLTKGEEGILISFDFGFEDIGDAINACKAAALDNLYHVYVEGNVFEFGVEA